MTRGELSAALRAAFLTGPGHQEGWDAVAEKAEELLGGVVIAEGAYWGHCNAFLWGHDFGLHLPRQWRKKLEPVECYANGRRVQLVMRQIAPASGAVGKTE